MLFAWADASGIISVFAADGLVAVLGSCSLLGCILATAVKKSDAVHDRLLIVWPAFEMLSPLAVESGEKARLPWWGLVS